MNEQRLPAEDEGVLMALMLSGADGLLGAIGPIESSGLGGRYARLVKDGYAAIKEASRDGKIAHYVITEKGSRYQFDDDLRLFGKR